jgi:hypothetical protein
MIDSNAVASNISKIELVVDHIKLVQRYTYRLGCKLILQGELELGRNLIANGQIHDNSKLKGIEFEHLFGGDPLLEDVRRHHVSINPHHPEYWGSVEQMPEVYRAEMVCDWYARASEFGTGLREYIDDRAGKRFGFTKGDPVYMSLQRYVNMLLCPPFVAP